jgi:hypothetical protein
MIGLHTVTLTPEGAGPVDLSCLVDRVSIHHGREDSDSQPEANTATLDLSLDTSDPATPFPPLEVGGRIQVTTTVPVTPGAVTSLRFDGRISDISQGWTDAGPDTPDRAACQVIAVGPLADLGRRVVGDAPWPQQLDGARIAAVMAAAGVTLDPATSDPGTVAVLARDVDSQPSLDVAQQTAVDAGGVIWSTRAAEIRYADANHRRGTVARLTLDACDVLVTPTWSRTTEGLVNDVSIGYGPTPEGGEQPRFLGDRPDSKTRFGVWAYTTATTLAAAADAAALGTMLLTRNSAPVWVLSSLPVDVGALDSDQTVTLLDLDMHDLLHLVGLPAAGAVPTSTYLWVEGWQETLAWGVHDFDAVVSGYCRTAPAPRWNDVAPAMTWDTAGALTWDGAACFGPLPDLGRWDDVPATTRWDQVPPATTRDTYTGGLN